MAENRVSESSVSVSSRPENAQEAESVDAVDHFDESFRSRSIRSSSIRSSTTSSRISITTSVRNSLNKGIGVSVLDTLKPQDRPSNDLSELTIDKLNFAKLGMHGRDAEVSTIMRAFESVDAIEETEPAAGKRHFVLISGQSGSGKSKLAEVLEQPTKKKNGLLVRGKHDLNLKDEPYSAIAKAFSKVCAEILDLEFRDPEASSRIRNSIKESLSSEISLLAQVIPALAELVDFDEDPASAQEGTSGQAVGEAATTEESKNRFQYAFLRFTRVITSCFKPFVMVLDDLQWIDASSLELIQTLISDKENQQFFMVGIYRSDEVDTTHILSRGIDELKTRSDDGDFELTQIHLSSLDVVSTQKIIQELLNLSYGDETRSMKLAEVCHKKTDGNIFYLLSFLALLKETKMIRFNLGTVSWTWDTKEIESGTSATTNVVGLLVSRMNLLPQTLIEILKLAACLGSEFDLRKIELLWLKSTDIIPSDEANVQTLQDGLDTLEQEGFIESIAKDAPSYRWVHDKVQEASLSLIPDSDRGLFNRRIGEILLSELQGDELDDMILIIVGLLNEGSKDELSADDSLRYARLNLQAAQKSVSMSAFESASAYAEKGVQLLPTNSWSEHYQLTLDLYSLGAKVEGALANVETMNTYCQAVLSQENIPTKDKFSVYNTRIDSIISRGLFGEAGEILLSLLSEFKCKFPKSKVMTGLSVVKQIVKVQVSTKSKDFSELKVMTDPVKIELMKLIDKLSTCFYSNNDDRMPLTIFRSLNWSIKHGCCDLSPVAFAVTGLVLTGALNDLRAGSHFGEQALELLNRNGYSSTKCRTMLLAYSHVLIWTKPAGTVTKPLLEAYEAGLRSGDTENAMWAIFHYILAKRMVGSPLKSLEADALTYSKQAKQLKKLPIYYDLKILRQIFLNLMGRDNTDDPCRIVGDSVTQEDYEYCVGNKFLKSSIWMYSCFLLAYFGKFQELVDAQDVDFIAKTFVGLPDNMWHSFLYGISCFAVARETGKKKYLKTGEIVLAKIKKWTKMGNPNVWHFESLLEAELLGLKGDSNNARKKFETSILLAARGGYQQDAAFASERYGRYCLEVEKDQHEAGYRLGEAVKYWNGWGAVAKVRALEAEFTDLIKKPTQIFVR